MSYGKYRRESDFLRVLFLRSPLVLYCISGSEAWFTILTAKHLAQGIVHWAHSLKYMFLEGGCLTRYTVLQARALKSTR